ncbi:MAG: CRISPR-associated endoribonuclease Cas6 [Bacteroidota bacterium]|nr:CRISPR-associated endoribonuclease Cas6 [Bacteroidota bacterium]
MRFKLTFTVDRVKSPLPILPVQYQYPVSCWIYKTIREGNSDYRGWLKKNGFISSKQVFKMFTFSNFLLEENECEVRGDRIMLLNDELTMILSSLVKVDISEYVEVLFKGQELSLGDKKSRVFFKISKVISLREEIPDHPRLRLISPMVVSAESIPEENKIPATFLSPQDEEYKYYFFRNLLQKDQIRNGMDPAKAKMDLEDIEMEILSDPVKVPTPIKSGNEEPKDIPAYSFVFEIKAPEYLIRSGMNAGFGVLNSKGFGCAEVVEEEDDYPYPGRI